MTYRLTVYVYACCGVWDEHAVFEEIKPSESSAAEWGRLMSASGKYKVEKLVDGKWYIVVDFSP